MIKNRTTQLIFQTIYCTLGFVGCIACLGIFDNINAFRWDFYVHFTNLSNFLCLGVMLAALIQTARKKEDSYVTIAPVLKFVGLLGILLTFLVFNFLLAGAADRDPQRNWYVGSLIFHVTLPILYVADWFLFYERRKCKWYYPIVSAGFPIAYIIFIFVHAAILNFDSSILIPGSKTSLIYPYFFLNLETQGVAGVAKWILILAVGYIAGGFLCLALDRLGKKDPAK